METLFMVVMFGFLVVGSAAGISISLSTLALPFAGIAYLVKRN